MRVLHVAQSVAGGIGAYFEEVARFQNAVFGAENVRFVVPAGSAVHLPSIPEGQLVSFPRTGRGPLALASFGLTALRAIGEWEPDVVHMHSSFAGGVVRPLLAIGRHPVRVVYCPHGWAFGMETTNLRKFAYAEYERLLAHWTDLIVVNSDSERRLASQYRIPSGKVRTIKNGVSRRPRCGGERLGSKERRIQLAFIGRHDRQKGLDILLQAVEQLEPDHIHLHVVGKGILEAGRLGKAPIQENVTFHGWLSRKAIFNLLDRIDAVVMPSRWEAFGLVAIEAMRSGVAVIASDRGALPEIVRHGVEGYIFDLDDPQGLRSLLPALDRTELRRMGEAARARFEAEFTAERMNLQLQGAYERAVTSQSVRKPAWSAPFGAADTHRRKFGAVHQKPS